MFVEDPVDFERLSLLSDAEVAGAGLRHVVVAVELECLHNIQHGVVVEGKADDDFAEMEPSDLAAYQLGLQRITGIFRIVFFPLRFACLSKHVCDYLLSHIFLRSFVHQPVFLNGFGNFR